MPDKLHIATNAIDRSAKDHLSEGISAIFL